MGHIFFIRLSFGGHLGDCLILVIINNVAMNKEVHICFQVTVLDFFESIPRVSEHIGRGLAMETVGWLLSVQ